MKIAKLKVVVSTSRVGQMSLRGPKGRGQDDGPHAHITAAGFEDGEDVVLLSAAEFKALVEFCHREGLAGAQELVDIL